MACQKLRSQEIHTYLPSHSCARVADSKAESNAFSLAVLWHSLDMSDTYLFKHAYQGSLIADALAMPVHWYYDRDALLADYGEISGFQAPKNPHHDSILWRSSYTPENENGDILREQAQYWGQRGVHYHQFLKAGENTLNFKLARELVRWADERGSYDPDAWLERYIEVMLTPNWHQDTYLEEVHRGFFTAYSRGKKPRKCSVRDEHIGGLAQVPALCYVLRDLGQTDLRATVKEHVGLTHAHANVQRAADTLVRVLWKLREGESLDEAIRSEAGDWISLTKCEKWITQPDTHVIGGRFSPACYIDQAMPAALYLSIKYQNDFAAAIQANAQVGGDNCHRGAVVGSLVAALCPKGLEDWMEQLV